MVKIMEIMVSNRILCLHGYNPSDLLLLTIISIPNDLKGSLSKSDNYRDISLVNSICKLFHHLLLIILLQCVLQYIWKSLINIR